MLYENEDIEEAPDTPAPPSASPVGDVNAPTFSKDVDNEQLEFTEMDEEELVSLTLRRKQEAMKTVTHSTA